MISVISTLTAMLVAVCTLGVFNTVVLSTRERRKDLGVLKSIGMTPGQLIAVVGTLVPSFRASRASAAEVLRTE